MNRKLIFVGLIALILAVYAMPAMADPGRGTTVLCYVWANSPTTASYSPSSFYSYNANGKASANIITRTGVGAYTVTCRGVGGAALGGGTGWGPGGHVQVTSYGSEDADYCKVSSWGTGGADFTAFVRCYNHAGGASDNRFDLLFVW
jgi:hypothetical protein